MLGRSVHRPKDDSLARIDVRWRGQSKPVYTLRDSHLEKYPIFGTFNETFFNKHQLPDSFLAYRYAPTKKVRGKTLKNYINSLIKEISQKKKKFTDFTVLRSRDFNRRKCSGLIILKCKHHPFVVKIFMENPKTFIMHGSKGIIPAFFFYMSGGVNRHLLGFTRIKNLQLMQVKVQKNKKWKNQVVFPRKWFYLPEKSRWLEITGTNIGTKKQKIAIPATYCLVSDWIDSERTATVFNRSDRKRCMSLCNCLELGIDPHIDNFLIERKTKKIAIVDTEHFPTVVGIKKKREFRGYFSWISRLGIDCAKSLFFRNKEKRKNVQKMELTETQLLYDDCENKEGPPKKGPMA